MQNNFLCWALFCLLHCKITSAQCQMLHENSRHGVQAHRALMPPCRLSETKGPGRSFCCFLHIPEVTDSHSTAVPGPFHLLMCPPNWVSRKERGRGWRVKTEPLPKDGKRRRMEKRESKCRSHAICDSDLTPELLHEIRAAHKIDLATQGERGQKRQRGQGETERDSKV